MSDLIRTINTADLLFTLWWRGQFTFIELVEYLVALGCYNITATSFSYAGVAYEFRITP